ncbi:MAG: LicD family protein [Ruminococcaceae bacterium]|nr:LicD family protein [Oscillospiraceae bacterium]
MTLTPEQTQELQAVELEIFKHFTNACVKLNIKYFLVAGTLLGAVRHQGFIPWDDDIDVAMFREDYEKFLKEAQSLLPEHIFLQTYSTDLGYHKVFAKLRNENTTFIECSVKSNKMSHGMFIDIFPLDYCDTDTKSSTLFKLKERIYSLRSSSLAKDLKLDFKKRLIRQGCKLVCPDPRKALIKLERLHTSMKSDKYVTNFSSIYGDKEIMPIDWYGDGALITFEGLTVSVPKEYDKWLSTIYGNYMELPAPENRVSHHLTVAIDTRSSYKNKL